MYSYRRGIVVHTSDVPLSEIRLAAGTPEQVQQGYGTLRLDGVALRRTLDGRLSLSFPARRHGSDRPHFYFRPVDDRARREIEHEVLKAIGIEEMSGNRSENE